METSKLIGQVSQRIPVHYSKQSRDLAGQIVRLAPLPDSFLENRIDVISVNNKKRWGSLPICYINADKETWEAFEAKVGVLQKEQATIKT